MVRLVSRAVLPAMLLAVALTFPRDGRAADPARAILGEWHGASTCTKAPWNAACHDEENVYRFERAANPDTILGAGYKRAGDTYAFMGDLPLTYDRRSREWAGDFANGRVHVRVSYQARGSALTGKIVDLRTARVVRRIAARRDVVSRLPRN